MRRALPIALGAASLSAPALASDTERTAFDARPDKAAAPGQPTQALKRALGEQGLVSTDPHTGTVRAAGRLDGALTGPSARSGEDVALDYVREHGRALGLPGGVAPGLGPAQRAVSSGLEVLTWRQRHRGIPSADTFLRAAIDGQGRLLSLTGAPAADLEPPTTVPAIAAADALEALTGAPAPAGSRARGGAGGDPERTTSFPGGGRASLVLYRGDGGTRLAWRVLAPLGDDELADALVDATDGTVVKRANRVKFATNAKVFRGSPDDPAGQLLVPLTPWDTAADRLLGTRVHAFADPADDVKAGGVLAPKVETSAWENPLIEYPGCGVMRCTWQPGNRLANRDQSATQLYYFVNTFLDHLAASPIGFSDATGGFGAGDRIVAQAMDDANGTERNNASFTAYADGGPGLLEVHLFDAFGDHLDGANDASLVFHEVTHGLSERLVTDAQGFGALTSAQAAAIGEATSDFFALDYLVEQGLQPGTNVRFGAYLGGWMRDSAIDGDELGYGALTDEPHADGELWAQTLWDLRDALGIGTARRVITGALRIAPPEPSFLDMRNALLIANQDEGRDRDIWAVFAARGMGYFASSDGADDTDPEPSEVDPHAPGALTEGKLEGIVVDEEDRPVADAHVVIGARVDGLGPFIGAETGSDGRYELRGLVGPHPVIVARKPAYAEDRFTGAQLPTTHTFRLTRDYSSSAGGAKVDSFTGQDNTAGGCGPARLIDDRGDSVWSTTVGGESVIVDLGAPIDLSAIRIDPNAGCGDDPPSALGTAEVHVAGGSRSFVRLGSTTFTAASNATLADAFSAAQPAVRYVKLIARAPQDAGAANGYVDVAELQVLKQPGTPVGPTADTGAATAVGPFGATLNASVAPNGGAVPDVIFEYGTSAAYGSAVAASGSPAASAAITGLAPSTRYHFRVVALRDGRRYEGANGTFLTAGAPAGQPPDEPLVSSKIRSRRLTADRRGRFSLRVRFASDAPTGTARIAVQAGKVAVAKAKVGVRRGQTRKVALKLNAAGRRKIAPGRTRKVRVVVRLPGGGKFARTVKLTRKR